MAGNCLRCHTAAAKYRPLKAVCCCKRRCQRLPIGTGNWSYRGVCCCCSCSTTLHNATLPNCDTAFRCMTHGLADIHCAHLRCCCICELLRQAYVLLEEQVSRRDIALLAHVFIVAPAGGTLLLLKPQFWSAR